MLGRVPFTAVSTYLQLIFPHVTSLSAYLYLYTTRKSLDCPGDMADQTTDTTAPQPPKSPPMAFEPTSNDVLAPSLKPSERVSNHFKSSGPSVYGAHEFGPTSMEQELQAQIEKQAEALHSLHEGFSKERESWRLERDRLYRRIDSLEALFKIAGGHR